MKKNLIKKEKKLEIIKIQMVQKKNTFGQKKILHNNFGIKFDFFIFL